MINESVKKSLEKSKNVPEEKRKIVKRIICMTHTFTKIAMNCVQEQLKTKFNKFQFADKSNIKTIKPKLCFDISSTEKTELNKLQLKFEQLSLKSKQSSNTQQPNKYRRRQYIVAHQLQKINESNANTMLKTFSLKQRQIANNNEVKKNQIKNQRKKIRNQINKDKNGNSRRNPKITEICEICKKSQKVKKYVCQLMMILKDEVLTTQDSGESFCLVIPAW